MEKNDDEQEQFVPGPAQSGSGEVFAFHIEEINNSCRGRILPTFVLGGGFDLQTLVTILLGGGIGPQKTFMVIGCVESALALSVGQFSLHTSP